jgi:hypothetical protein
VDHPKTCFLPGILTMFLTEQMDASSISKFKGIYEVPTFIRLYAMQKKLVDFPKKTVSNCLFVFNGGVPVGMVPEPLTLQLFVNDQKKTLSSLLSIEAYHPMLPTIPQISPQKLWRAF